MHQLNMYHLKETAPLHPSLSEMSLEHSLKTKIITPVPGTKMKAPINIAFASSSILFTNYKDFKMLSLFLRSYAPNNHGTIPINVFHPEV